MLLIHKKIPFYHFGLLAPSSLNLITIFLVISATLFPTGVKTDTFKRCDDVCWNKNIPNERIISECTISIEKNSKNSMAYYCRGTAYFRNGNPGNAIADLDEAIKLIPDDSEYHYDRGLVRESMGDVHGALDDFKTFIAQGGTRKNIKKRIEKLELSLKNDSLNSSNHQTDDNSKHYAPMANDVVPQNQSNQIRSLEIRPGTAPSIPVGFEAIAAIILAILGIALILIINRKKQSLSPVKTIEQDTKIDSSNQEKRPKHQEYHPAAAKNIEQETNTDQSRSEFLSDTIARLSQLRENGIITNDEFESEKKRLLDM